MLSLRGESHEVDSEDAKTDERIAKIAKLVGFLADVGLALVPILGVARFGRFGLKLLRTLSVTKLASGISILYAQSDTEKALRDFEELCHDDLLESFLKTLRVLAPANARYFFEAAEGTFKFYRSCPLAMASSGAAILQAANQARKPSRTRRVAADDTLKAIHRFRFACDPEYKKRIADWDRATASFAKFNLKNLFGKDPALSEQIDQCVPD